MARTKTTKQSLLAELARHVLANGLNTASLRPMAAAANTSDRMLIYHFGSKDGLIAALLEYLADEMAKGLETALPPKTFATERELVETIVRLLRSPDFKPYSRIWLDIVSAAAQGNTSHQAAGHAVIQMFLDWVAVRHPDGMDGAPFALTFIEGTLIMDAVGHGAVTESGLRGMES